MQKAVPPCAGAIWTLEPFGQGAQRLTMVAYCNLMEAKVCLTVVGAKVEPGVACELPLGMLSESLGCLLNQLRI